MLAYPGDHLLDVDQLIGEFRCGKQAVVRADAHPSVAREPIEQVTCSEVLAAEAEASRVEVDERWAARKIGALAVQVEPVSPSCRAVAEVRDPLDTVATEGDRRHQNADERRSTAEPSGEPGVHAVTPAGSEALAQGALDRRARLPRSPTEDDKPGRRHDGETEPDPEDRRRDAVLGDGQRGRGGEHEEGSERPVEHNPEEVAQAERARPTRPVS
jgi:hypothetical protein